MRRLALPLLLVLALLFLGWWGARTPDDGDEGALTRIERDGVAPIGAQPLALGEAGEEAPAPRLVGMGHAKAPRPEGMLAATLRVRVLGPDGAPSRPGVVQLARVVLLDPSADFALPPGVEGAPHVQHVEVGRRVPNIHGDVVFSDLAPGRYRVEAFAPPGLLAAWTEVGLEAVDQDVVITYRRAVDARIEVLDPEGNPVAQARIALLRAHAGEAVTDAEGVALLTELDPEWELGLRIRPPSTSNLHDLTLDPWRVRDTHVVLEAGLSIAGRVVDEDGEPVPKARVHRHVEGDAWKITTTGRDGRFSFERLRAGEVLTLRAGPPGSWADAVTEAVAVVAGTEDLVIVLPHGAVLDVVVPNWPAGARGMIQLTTTSKAPIRRSAPIQESGHCTFRYLDPRDVHVLWGVLQGDERFLHRARVRAQAEPLEVRLEEGEPLHVRVEVPEGVALTAVEAFGPGVYRRALLTLAPDGTVGFSAPDGTIRIPPLPVGRWEVRALGTSFGPAPRGREAWTAEAVAETSDVVELVLRKAD